MISRETANNDSASRERGGFRIIPGVLLGLAGLVTAMLNAPYVSADTTIYRFVDENSVVHFSDAPIDARFKRIAKYSDLSLRVGNDDRFLDEIFAASDSFDVDPALIMAVIKVESDFKETATSEKGAMGLMQLTRSTADKYDVDDAYSPSQNIWAGVKHLKYLLTLFEGDTSLALAAYNAGVKAVKRYGGVPPYPETRRYIRRVLKNYYSLR
jgi:hypothetical protein